MDLAFRHLSVRIPWHDSAWNGAVCRQPRDNAACICLPAIRETRDDAWEESVAGRRFTALGENLPPCVRERASFLSPEPLTLTLRHKLEHDESWEHIQPTPLELPAFSVPALPFRWMMRGEAAALAETLGTRYSPEREPMDGWKARGTWVLDADNQRACLDAFWSAIVPGRSLVFFYAKAIPGVEDPRRVLLGAGFVDGVSKPRPFINGDPDGAGSWIWECPVRHSVRPEDCRNGFVLPYHELLARVESGAAIAMEECVAFAPDEHREEFSYATEHVTADGALAAITAMIESAERMRTIIAERPWERILRWLNDRLNDVREQRGACPGLGSSLTAWGLNCGARLAAHLTRDLPPEADPWAAFGTAVANKETLPAELQREFTSTRRKKWEQLRTKYPQRLEFLRLLSRFALTCQQAEMLWDGGQRKQAGVEESEADFLANPYLLAERFRHPAVLSREVTDEQGKVEKEWWTVAPISFWTIDRGVFLPAALAAHHPLPGSAPMDGADDPRRLRALAGHVLHSAAEREGHTYLPLTLLAARASGLRLEPHCEVKPEDFELFEDDWEEEIVFSALADGTRAAQLAERDATALAIRNLLRRARHAAARSEIVADWPALILQKLEETGRQCGPDDAAARAEKALALAELAASPFSVLIGPAGTGKTTLLKALCAEPTIEGGGVLLLAPTGKARVRMQQAIGAEAQTLAQFLIKRGRYEAATGRYRANPHFKKETDWKTVIVDEASMLTEDQLAALLDAITGTDRLILVGDPSQLPPIGVGKPFVDLVTALRPGTGAAPCVAPGYAELTVRMRQQQDGAPPDEEPEDLRLAELFSSDERRVDDEILRELAQTPEQKRLRFVGWERAEDLREKLGTVLMEELKVTSGQLGDLCETLGATPGAKGNWYFNAGCEKKIEAWQMLSPVRVAPGAGTEDLNRVLQHALRGDMLKYAAGKMAKTFRVPKPAGPQQAVLGDKVINTMNRNHRYVWPEAGALKYVANGEIGVIVGESYGVAKPEPWRPGRLQIAFGSQPGFRYSFFASSLSDDGELPLELAYAITVHKAQGSEFPIVFLVLPRHAATLCRELLYTALTRHRGKLVVFGQGSPLEMRRFASASASAVARRFTNVTAGEVDPSRQPCPVAVTDRKTGRVLFYERSLIHLTRAGFLVRSKSEVIIANELDHARAAGRLVYEYEEPLADSSGGSPRYPDFTVRSETTLRVWYWEHLGMLGNKRYRDDWKKKEAWYAARGITRWDAVKNPNGQLVITEDGENGEIDAEKVARHVAQLGNG